MVLISPLKTAEAGAGGGGVRRQLPCKRYGINPTTIAKCKKAGLREPICLFSESKHAADARDIAVRFAADIILKPYLGMIII